MRTVFRRLLGISSKEVEIDYSSYSSVKAGFRRAGYPDFEPTFLKSYQKEVEEIVSSGKEIDIKNFTPHHTCIILSQMLKMNNQNPQFLMYERDLSGDILELSNETTLYEDFKSYLDRGNEVQIIIPLKESTLKKPSVIKKFKDLSAQYEKFKIFELNSYDLERNSELESIPFFAVSGKAYRKEKQKETREAICSFKNEKTSGELTEKFLKLRNISKPMVYQL